MTKTTALKKAAPRANLDRILAAASGLFTTQGFHGTSTREIAAKAGVHRLFGFRLSPE